MLEPAKTITDPVHGDIFLTKLEQAFLDGPPMQRLRRVRQLGTTHLVYPGATHSRFSHALGALRSAQDLLDTVLTQRHGPDPTPDLLGEWEGEFDSAEFQKLVAEATVLARLGALLHDLCHVPFGHSVEDDLGAMTSHDTNGERFEKLWLQFDQGLRDAISPELKAALTNGLILKPVPGSDAAPYEFVGDVVGNTICADLLDYLRRDHLYTGLPASLGRRFLSGFYVTRSDNPQHPRRMVIRIARDGRERHDVISEMFKYLRYRYELSERALVHHAKLAADAMVGKMLEIYCDAESNRIAAEISSKVKSYESDIRATIRRIDMATGGGGLADEVKSRVTDQLEDLFLAHGDDGLLEHILAASRSRAAQDKRAAVVAELSDALINRRLYKPIGRCGNRSVAARLYRDYGLNRDAKRELEIDVSRFAGLEEGWHVVLWVPRPDMRLKEAEVLVSDGDIIAELRNTNVGKNRGREIYDAHEDLWAITVYVHPSVKENRELCEVILAYLAEKMGGVQWDGMSSQLSVRRLLAARVRSLHPCTVEQEQQLVELAGQVSAHGGSAEPTFNGLADALEAAASEILSTQGKLRLKGGSTE